MPISMAAAKERTRTVEVEYAEETAKVWYYPHRFSKTMLREVTEAGDGVDKLIAQLVLLVAKWEIVDANNTPLPVTQEVLSEIPLDLLNEIMRQINKVQAPGETNGASSSDI